MGASQRRAVCLSLRGDRTGVRRFRQRRCEQARPGAAEHARVGLPRRQRLDPCPPSGSNRASSLSPPVLSRSPSALCLTSPLRQVPVSLSDDSMCMHARMRTSAVPVSLSDDSINALKSVPRTAPLKCNARVSNTCACPCRSLEYMCMPMPEPRILEYMCMPMPEPRTQSIGTCMHAPMPLHAYTTCIHVPPRPCRCHNAHAPVATWHMVHGAWYMAHGAWCMVHGAWYMVHGTWYTSHAHAYVLVHTCMHMRVVAGTAALTKLQGRTTPGQRLVCVHACMHACVHACMRLVCLHACVHVRLGSGWCVHHGGVHVMHACMRCMRMSRHALKRCARICTCTGVPTMEGHASWVHAYYPPGSSVGHVPLYDWLLSFRREQGVHMHVHVHAYPQHVNRYRYRCRYICMHATWPCANVHAHTCGMGMHKCACTYA